MSQRVLPLRLIVSNPTVSICNRSGSTCIWSSTDTSLDMQAMCRTFHRLLVNRPDQAAHLARLIKDLAQAAES